MNSKPFIHLYRSPRGYYLYDVNKDTIIAVSSAVYNYLDDKKSFEELSSETAFNGYRRDQAVIFRYIVT